MSSRFMATVRLLGGKEDSSTVAVGAPVKDELRDLFVIEGDRADFRPAFELSFTNLHNFVVMGYALEISDSLGHVLFKLPLPPPLQMMMEPGDTLTLGSQRSKAAA